MNKETKIFTHKILEKLGPEARSAWGVILSEWTELRTKYDVAKNTKGTPDWVISAREAEYSFACAIVAALPNFVFDNIEYKIISNRNDFIHLCWVEWNTTAQKEKYEDGHDINCIEDVMDIVGETLCLPLLSTANQSKK